MEHATAIPQQTPSIAVANSVGMPEPAADTRLFGMLPLQCKLTVGAPDDPMEREADTVADHVMSMPEPFVQRKCAHCEDEEKIQRKPLAGLIQRQEVNGGSEAGEAVLSGISDSIGSGQKIDTSTRSFMEGRFGTDFRDVHIHTGEQAANMNNELGARAFTVGSDIYFNEGEYRPHSAEGRHLMAHELTHVVQQSGTVNRKLIQRRTVTLNSGRTVGTLVNPTANLREDVLDVMNTLHTMWCLNNADYTTEYASVSALGHMTQVPTASMPRTIAALNLLDDQVLNYEVAAGAFDLTLTNHVGRGMANVKADILSLIEYMHQRRFLTDGEYSREQSSVSSGADPVSEGSIPQTLHAIPRMKMRRVMDGYRHHDVMSGTHAITRRARSRVEAQLIPGASSSGGSTTVPTPHAICSRPADLEAEIRADIEPYVHTSAANFRTRRGSAPVLPLTQMNSMADVAQEELQDYFGEYLRGATRLAGSAFTPGAYTIRSQLRDQSATTQWQNAGGRTSWVNYWISTRLGNAHHCDQADIDAVATSIATDATLRADIDETVQSWPAEATGGININPYLADATSDTGEIRRTRWDAFTTIIHEAIHHFAHPNFINTYSQMTDESSQILKEGFADMFRHELWFAPGNLRTRIGATSYNPRRTIIEGAPYPYDSSVVQYHSEYDQIRQAQNIRRIIGIPNAKAAYFLGHTELLGIGPGSPGLSATGSYAGVAGYTTHDPAEENVVDVLAGEDYNALIIRINAPSGRILDPTTRRPLAVGAALPATVRVNGIRHVTVTPGDTLSSIASQNGVTQYDIVRANALTSSGLGGLTRVLIPIH